MLDWGACSHLQVVRLPKVELVTSGQVDMATLTPCTSAVDIWALVLAPPARGPLPLPRPLPISLM